MIPDANILVYAVNQDAPQHEASTALIKAAEEGLVTVELVPQVLLEFFSVVTNPRRVPQALTPADAWQRVATLRSALPLLPVQTRAMDLLDTLVSSRQPRGRAVYDLFLAAQILSHGIRTICTYNVRDFQGIAGIEAITPDEALRRYLA